MKKVKLIVISLLLLFSLSSCEKEVRYAYYLDKENYTPVQLEAEKRYTVLGLFTIVKERSGLYGENSKVSFSFGRDNKQK